MNPCHPKERGVPMTIRSLSAVAIFALLLMLLGGCATTDPDQPYQMVKDDIKARTGEDISWQRSQDTRRQMVMRIQEMLLSGLTLKEAIAIGLVNNRRIQGFYQELGVAQADVVQAQLLDNPHFGFAYLGSPSDLYKIELEAVFNIMSLFLMPLRQAVAEARMERARCRVSKLVLEQIFAVQKAYISLQADQQAFRLRQRVLLSSEASYEMAERMRAAGNITKLELLSRKSLLDEDRLALSSASLAVTQSRERLNRLMGLWGEDLVWDLPDNLPPPPEKALDQRNLEQKAIGASLDIALAKSELKVAARELGITNVTSVIPELNVGAAFEREEDDTWLGGPAFALEVPLFDPGHAKRSRANAIVAQRWESLWALAVDIRAKVRQAARRLDVMREQARYYERSFLPLRKAMTRQAQRRYNGMFMGVFELLMIKRMEIEASMGYVNALKNYWLAHTDMTEILSGTLPAMQFESFAIRPVSMGGSTGGGH
jgi:cobalt-zinc-cadmium efflux system outer membrane protein